MALPSRAGALIVLTTLVTLELLRASGPALDAVAGGHGVPLAGLAALTVYGAAALAGPLSWWLGSRHALLTAVCALGAARLLVQIPAARVLPVLGAAVAVALVATLLAVRSALTASRGPARAARAVALGVALDVAIRLPLDLWDPLWRGGLLGWTVAVLVGGMLVGVGLAKYREGAATPVPVTVRMAALGPVLALLGVFLASPAFTASQGGMSVTAAGLWITAGLLAGIAVLSYPHLPLPGAGRGAAVSLGVLLVALFLIPGPPTGPLTALALALVPALLGRALAPRDADAGGRPLLSGLTLAGGGCGLGYVLVVLPYQAHYEMPMPVPNQVFPLLGAALLGWAVWHARPTLARTRRPVVPLLAAGLLCAVPPLAGALRAAPEPLPTDTADGSYTLLSWNVHYGVDRGAEVVPDRILEVIRDSGAHVVVLQEVPRGWPIGGGTDLKTWLEQRLDVEAVWVPAADRQFGNLILTSLPVTESETAELPRAGGTMKRSYAAATVELGNGSETRVGTTHLQHAEASDTRMAQLDRLLRAHADEPFTVLAGDFNAEPGDEEIDTLLDAGFRSAQDEAGDPDALTYPTHDPEVRIDWVFGDERADFTDFATVDSAASDHFPLTVTVSQR